MKGYKTNHFESKVVHGYEGYDDKTGAISYPIYQSATFRHAGLGESTGFDYSRLKNPTRSELEKTMAVLENGYEGFAFSSGMAAISTLMKLFKSGDHLVVSDDLYGGTYRILNDIYSIYNIEVTFVDTTEVELVKDAIKDNTKAVIIETPSNPTMKVADIKAISDVVMEVKNTRDEVSSDLQDILLIVDNTFMTPYYQQPLELGANIVVHSGTKYLGGHNDALAGLLVVDSEILAERIFLIQKSEGAVLAPFDSWLILRGIKTLSVRLDRQSDNAAALAAYLNGHDKIGKVYFAGLESHKGYEINQRQSKGHGAMISFEVKDIVDVEKVLKRVKLITFAESLGGVETLITYPMVQTHSAIPEEIRNRVGVTDKLLRLSVGIEHIDDLIEDLAQALS